MPQTSLTTKDLPPRSLVREHVEEPIVTAVEAHDGAVLVIEDEGRRFELVFSTRAERRRFRDLVQQVA